MDPFPTHVTAASDPVRSPLPVTQYLAGAANDRDFAALLMFVLMHFVQVFCTTIRCALDIPVRRTTGSSCHAMRFLGTARLTRAGGDRMASRTLITFAA